MFCESNGKPTTAEWTPELIAKCRALAPEWESFCRADYESYKKAHAQPFIAHFYAGSAFFNAYERWDEDWKRHCRQIGEAWWNYHGFTVTSYPYREPITVAPMAVDAVVVAA